VIKEIIGLFDGFRVKVSEWLLPVEEVMESISISYPALMAFGFIEQGMYLYRTTEIIEWSSGYLVPIRVLSWPEETAPALCPINSITPPVFV
jgi:hypothetical protein